MGISDVRQTLLTYGVWVGMPLTAHTASLSPSATSPAPSASSSASSSASASSSSVSVAPSPGPDGVPLPDPPQPGGVSRNPVILIETFSSHNIEEDNTANVLKMFCYCIELIKKTHNMFNIVVEMKNVPVIGIDERLLRIAMQMIDISYPGMLENIIVVGVPLWVKVFSVYVSVSISISISLFLFFQ